MHCESEGKNEQHEGFVDAKGAGQVMKASEH